MKICPKHGNVGNVNSYTPRKTPKCCICHQPVVTIEVRRNRPTVTQGSATVLINGKEVMTFHDTIKIITKEMADAGQKACGEQIGSWASVIPDSEFIIGLLYHPYEDFSKLVKEALQ